jgi:hypothetical protein
MRRKDSAIKAQDISDILFIFPTSMNSLSMMYKQLLVRSQKRHILWIPCLHRVRSFSAIRIWIFKSDYRFSVSFNKIFKKIRIWWIHLNIRIFRIQSETWLGFNVPFELLSGLLACTLTRPKGIVGQKTYCKMAGKRQANSDSHNSFHLFNESKKSES